MLQGSRRSKFCTDQCAQVGVMEWCIDDRVWRARSGKLRMNDDDMPTVEVGDSFVLALAGLEPGGWVIDKPLKRAKTGRPNGRDLELRWTGDWDWDGFVKEFGLAGAEVGQTYLLVGETLGASE